MVMLLGAAPAALAIDLPIARWVRAHACPAAGAAGPPWRKVFDLAEVFGHRYGLALIGGTVLVVAPRVRRRVPRLWASAYGGGLACDALKLVLGRTRPYRASLDGSVFDTFVGWWPLSSIEALGGVYGRDWQSFPSGHAGAAVALAWALTVIYPHGRGWFAVLALLALTQRVLAAEHYLSDVLMGGAVGCLVAGVVHRSAAAGRWFDRFER